MYKFFSRLYPKKIRNNLIHLLGYYESKLNKDRVIGAIFVYCFLFSLALSFFTTKKLGINWLLLFLLYLFVTNLVSYFLLLLGAEKKARFIESILPDVLQLMASNLRAGFTVDKAFLLSARPEFGYFQDYINRVGKEIAMGKDIYSALRELGKGIKSEDLNKTILLIESAIKSGGELAPVLEQAAKNLRKKKFIDEKIRSNVMMYVIFIFSAVGFGAPLLFGLSSFLVEVLTTTLGKVSIPQTSLTASLPLSFRGLSLNPSFVVKYCVISLITTSILGSLVVGSISRGKGRAGAKYIPFIIIVSLGFFFFVRFVIKNLIGELLSL